MEIPDFILWSSNGIRVFMKGVAMRLHGRRIAAALSVIVFTASVWMPARVYAAGTISLGSENIAEHTKQLNEVNEVKKFSLHITP